MEVDKVRKGQYVIRKKLTVSSKNVDPALAALFTSTLNPSSAIGSGILHTQIGNPQAPSTGEPTSGSHERDTTAEFLQDEFSASGKDLQYRDLPNGHEAKSFSRKRKRKDTTDNVEAAYLQRLAYEESREEHERLLARDEKRQKSTLYVKRNDAFSKHGNLKVLDNDESSISEAGNENPLQLPLHESLQASKDETEIEKASRTVFLGNVSTLAIKSKSSKRLLLDHLISFVPLLPEHKPMHKIESLRFRSTAFSTASVPRKAAYVKKELMDETTKSTNAYAVYSTALAAREAVRQLNGSIILERHLRVDSVAHPAKIDHRRCVFIGNLGFVADESKIRATEKEASSEKPKKSKNPKEPADAEEGLWRQFGKAGIVESVRVIRDKTTRVGKGVAYVQFQDPNAVERALLYNEKKFPPMLPRILRVTRAKSIRKTASYVDNIKVGRKDSQSREKESYKQKTSSEAQSLSGRADRLLGHAGAAHLRNTNKGDSGNINLEERTNGVANSAGAMVFEGYRASSKGRPKAGGRLGKRQGKPRTRSSKRGAAFKASGGKRQRKRENR